MAGDVAQLLECLPSMKEDPLKQTNKQALALHYKKDTYLKSQH